MSLKWPVQQPVHKIYLAWVAELFGKGYTGGTIK